MGKRRVFLLGIDGGSWDVMLPLVEMGLMPGLGGLMKSGRHGVLQSTYPYITCPAWNCMASGRNPGGIGVYGFMNIKPSSYELSYYDYHRDPEVPEIWDILEEEDYTSGIYNNPVIREPRPVNGYMVPGFLADDNEYRTYPASLRRFIETASGGYEFEPRGFSIMQPEKTIRECGRILDKHYRVMRALLLEHPVDFFLGVFHLTDRVCHNVLNLTGLPLDPEADELSASVARFFGKLDGYMASLVEEFVGENDLLVVLSDHGFAPYHKGFLLNSWLIKEGYLKVEASPRGLSGLGINQKRIAAGLERMGLLKLAFRLAPHVPQALRNWVPRGEGTGNRISVIDLIQSGGVDWASSQAIGFNNHGIYLNTSDRPQGTVGAGKRESLLQELRHKLMDYRDPESGERPVQGVYFREELYSGPRTERAPDLMVEMVEGWTTKAFISDADEMMLPLTRADHSRDGMFVIKGPGVSGGNGDGRIEDIAPTVLDFLGVKARAVMDGDSLLR